MVNPLATELGKLKAKQEAEKQRQITAAKKREKKLTSETKETTGGRSGKATIGTGKEEKDKLSLKGAVRQRIQKQQEANAEKERQAQEQRQQNEASSSNSQNAPSSPSQTDDAIQQPASELPDDDGYGYEERKSGMTIKWNGALNKDISIRKTHHKIEKAKAVSLGLTSNQLYKHRNDQNRYDPDNDNSNTCHRGFDFTHLDPNGYTECVSGRSESQPF